MMIRTIFVAMAVLATAASPALAQKPGDRQAKQVKAADGGAIREGLAAIGQGGECTVTFTVGKDGKPKDMEPVCTPEAYAPYALKAMATVEYLPEIFDGETWETEDVKQAFKFGTVAAEGAPANPGKAPVVIKNLEPKDVERAIARVGGGGICAVKYVVGVNGEPKDIEPNCDPKKLDSHIKTAFEKMRFEPGQKDGKAVDWPMEQPLNLTKTDGK
jgi:hypothetical protein